MCEGICGLRVIGSKCMIEDLLLDIFCHGLAYVRSIHSWASMKSLLSPIDDEWDRELTPSGVFETVNAPPQA